MQCAEAKASFVALLESCCAMLRGANYHDTHYHVEATWFYFSELLCRFTVYNQPVQRGANATATRKERKAELQAGG